jgi:hypothetical protein
MNGAESLVETLADAGVEGGCAKTMEEFDRQLAAGLRSEGRREEAGQWRGAARPRAQGFDELAEHPLGSLIEELTACPTPSSARLRRHAVNPGIFAHLKLDDAELCTERPGLDYRGSFYPADAAPQRVARKDRVHSRRPRPTDL